jgi:hypothetical protein
VHCGMFRRAWDAPYGDVTGLRVSIGVRKRARAGIVSGMVARARTVVLGAKPMPDMGGKAQHTQRGVPNL